MQKPAVLRDLARRLVALAIASGALTAGATAAPGTPGVPQPPLQIYVEDFQNRPGPDPIVKLNAYTGATGQAYTANPAWLTDCNGWISSANQTVNGPVQVTDCVSQTNWNRTQQLAWALGLHIGQSEAAARDNYAVSAYTAGNPGPGLVEFETATNIPFAASNRFISFGVDVAAVNCGVSAPLFQFSLLDDAGVPIPAGSQINVCTSTTTFNIPALGGTPGIVANAGSYTSNGAVLISGASVGVRMVNNNGGGAGNDHAFDNITVLDATPQLDKEFGPTNLAVGAASTLTFTITNTTDLGAKTGWSFTDELSAGLEVASDEISTTCPAGVVTAPVGGSTIDASGNLTAGMASCTVTVPVTSTAAGTYTNDASNITSAVGISLPGSSSVTFGTQPNFVCSPTMYLGVGGPTQLVSIDTSTNPFGFPSIGAPYSPAYNSMGYDPVTNYIYATRWDAGTGRWRLLRIGSNGSVSDQGPIIGGGINSSTGIASGAVGTDGYYYVKNNGVAPLNVMWRIDLATRTAVAIPLSVSVSSSDLAWHNGLLYAHDQSNGNFYSIHPVSGAVNIIGQSGINDGNGFGSMIDASNGVFGRLNSGGFYRFDLTTGAATLISSSPTGVGDGTKCPLTAVELPADTQITKTDGSDTYAPGEDVTYTIVVSNDGPFGVQNALVNDPLPPGIVNASWTCGTPVNGGVCGVASSMGAISNVPVSLPAGASVTFNLTLSVPPDFSGDLVNTATITNPADVPDPDTTSNTATDTNDVAEPSLSVEKTGTLNDLDGDGLIDLGETISYSFRVTNDGNVTMTNVTVDDPLLTGAGVSVTPGPQTLAPGGSATFTATYAPTQPEIDAGQVSNTATGTGTDPEGDTIDSPPDTVVVPPDQTPALTVEKTGVLNDLDGDGLIDLGETITYSFLVTNSGTVTMTNVTVDDPLLTGAGVSITPGPQTLGPGGTATFTATYSPTQPEIDAGEVTNTATGTGTPPGGGTTDSPPDDVTVPPDDVPGLTMEKTGTLNDLDSDGLIDLGETITYSFLVTNSGAVTMTNVTVDDPLLTGAGVSVTPGPQTLAPGGTATFTATYSPTQPEIDAGQVTNTATGTGTPPGGGTIDSPPDTVTVPPDDAPGLTMEKTGTLNDLDGDGLIDLGETIIYSFRVTNSGAVTMTNVTVDDPLLSGAGISVTPGPQTLAPGGTATFTATYTPTQPQIDAGQVSNTATGTGTDPGGGTIDSPPDTVVVPPDQTPGLTVEKTGTLDDLDGDGLIDLGETITYSFLVTNTGAVTMTNVTVDDPLLSGAGISVSPGPQTLAPGGTATFTATYTPIQADIDAGSVTNTATGTGTDPGGGTTDSPPDTVTVPPDDTPGLTVEKTGTLNDLDGDDLLDLGETISYVFVVENTGTVTMTDVTVDDPLLSGAGVSVSPGPQTLAPGGTATFTATYTPVQADIDAGSVTNTATGTGTPPGGGTTDSPPDTVVVPPQFSPALTIAKTGTLNDLDADDLLDAGETIDYEFLVINTGSVTLTDVTVDDPLLSGAGISVSPGPQTLAAGASVTFTATYAPTLAEIDAGEVINTATGTGTIPGGGTVGSPPDTVVVPPQPGSLRLEKTGAFTDGDGNGYATPGDVLTYTLTVTNTGGQTVTDVWPDDPGPTFNGRPAGGVLSDFEPGPVTLIPGAEAVFTATYALTEEDILNAAAVDDGVANSAVASGQTGGGGLTSNDSTSVITMPAAEPNEISVTKIAELRRIRRGEQAPFTIRVTNNGSTAATGISVVDTMPPGFRYVEGSAMVDGVEVTPEVTGFGIRFAGLTVPADGEIVIRLRMLALSTAGPGEHVNRAHAEDSTGTRVSTEARATVEIIVEPVFDCGDVIGRVYDDRNRNGYQDEGELGLPGVRVATVNGQLVTTDAHGRFHVPCAMLPDQRIGSNFIMKVDDRTLPTGYRMTSENPRVVRLTAGKMTEINFGASIGRVVRLDLQDAAFEPGRLELREEWQQGIDQLIAFLAVEPSVLRLTYLDPAVAFELAEERLRHLDELISSRWRQSGGQYRLEIEMRVETGE